MGGIGPLDAMRFEPAGRLTGGQKGVEEAVASIVGKEALPNFILQEQYQPSPPGETFTSASKRSAMPILQPSLLRASLQNGVDQEGKHRGIPCAG
jgi:hypothetical protein